MSLNRMLSVAVLSLSSFGFLSGCGGKSAAPAFDDKGKKLYQGDLIEGIENIQKDTWVEECDKKNYEILKEMALAVHAHKDVIEELEDVPQRKGVKLVKFEGMSFTVPVEPTPVPRKGYQSDSISWQKIYEDYLTFKDDPKNRNWRWLNRAMRAVLMDDQQRVIDGRNYFLGPDSGPSVVRFDSEITSCVQDPTCTNVTVSNETREFLTTQPIYREILGELDYASGLEKKRKKLEYLSKYVSRDRRRYELFPYSQIRRRNEKTFEMPINPDAVSDRHALAFIEAEVEKSWKSDTREVDLVWEKVPAQAEKLMRLIFEAVLGGRAFVDRNDYTIHFFSGTDVKAIPHEFGHVLGFRDQYYTMWNPSTCVWTDYYSEEDIMSEHQTGVVLESHWNSLEKMYPLQSARP